MHQNTETALVQNTQVTREKCSLVLGSNHKPIDKKKWHAALTTMTWHMDFFFFFFHFVVSHGHDIWLIN